MAAQRQEIEKTSQNNRWQIKNKFKAANDRHRRVTLTPGLEPAGGRRLKRRELMRAMDKNGDDGQYQGGARGVDVTGGKMPLPVEAFLF